MALLERMGAVLLPLDLTDDSSIVSAAERIRSEQGRVDVLVNNAGYGSYGAVEDVPLQEARRQFEVNVFGLARLIQLVTPLAAVRKDPERVIDWGQGVGTTRCLVPRNQICSRRLQRLLAHGAQALRHRRDCDRARRHSH